MSNYHCRILLRWIIIGRRVDIGSDVNSIQFIGYWMNVHFAFDILSDGTFILQCVRLLLGEVLFLLRWSWFYTCSLCECHSYQSLHSVILQSPVIFQV